MDSRDSTRGATAYLLTEIREQYRRFIEFRSDAEAVVLSLWALHTWAIEAAYATPYMLITSPEKRSGKTRVLEVSEQVVAQPLRTDSISPAALFRVVEERQPTLLLDEIDATFNGQDRETLRGLINGGYTRNGRAVRVAGDGAGMKVREFSSFGAKAFAGIDNRQFPETVRDRSVVIRLRRRVAGGPRFRARHVAGETQHIRDAAAPWAEENVNVLADATPLLPEALHDRAQDIWEPLLAIAELADGDWPERARLAAVELCSTDGSTDDSLGVACLRDLRDLFDRTGASVLRSREMVTALNRIAESPWSSMRDGRGLDERGLADRLRPFEITPRAVRLPNGDNKKGYPRALFEDAWGRYLTELGNQPSRRHEPAVKTDVGDGVTPDGLLTRHRFDGDDGVELVADGWPEDGFW